MEYLFSIAILTGISVILATSFNLIIGYGGLMSVAHPILFALGAYSSGLLSSVWGVPVPLALLIGAAVALVASIGMSLPSLRISGDYLLIGSIGFQLGVLQIIKNVEFTGGPSGLTNIPPLFEASGWQRGAGYTLLVGAIALAVVLATRWIIGGEFGRAIVAMRDDETAFRALGRNPTQVKITLFAIGSGLAGLAGGLYAHYFLYLSPDQFDILWSAALLTMVVVGGIGTVWGPAVGAILLEGLPQAITFLDLPPSVMAPVQGLIFTALVLLFLFLRPQGLLGRRRSDGGTSEIAPDEPVAERVASR